jgi:hypothetical protein
MVTVLPDGGRPQSQRTDAEQVPFPHKLITAPGCGGGIIVLRKTPPGGSQAGFRDISTPRSHAPSNVRLHRDFSEQGTSAQPEGHRLGLVLPLDRARRLLALYRCLQAGHRIGTDAFCLVSRGIPGVNSRSASDQRGTRAGVKSLQ